GCFGGPPGLAKRHGWPDARQRSPAYRRLNALPMAGIALHKTMRPHLAVQKCGFPTADAG
ncbi:hypothetical protein KXV85_000500, partial [Aspergillus fumigatus]